jgi:hypothetical protein
MKLTSTLLKLSLLMATIQTVCAQEKQCTSCPDAGAQIQRTSIDVSISGISRTAQVYYTNEQGNVFLLPSFIINSIQIMNSKGLKNINNNGLFKTKGLSNFDPSRKTTDGTTKLLIKLTDLYNNPSLKSQIVTKFSTDNTINISVKKIEYIPNEDYLNEINASIEVKPTSNKLNTTFDRGVDENFELQFQISSEDLNSLDNQPLSALALKINGQYLAEFGQRDFLLTADFLNTKLVDALTKVSTQQGNQNAVFIPLGGTGKETSDITSKTVQLMSIEIKRFKNPSRDLEAEMLKVFVEKSLQTLYSQVNLATLDSATRVVLMLDNGIGLRTTIGKLKSAKSDMFKLSEEQLKSQFKKFYNEKSAISAGGGFEIFDLFGIDGEYKNSSDVTRSEEQLFETYKKNIDKLKQEFDGDLPIMPAMNLETVKSLKSNSYFNSVIKQIGEVEDKPKKFTMTISLATGVNQTMTDPDVINKLAFDLYNKTVMWLASQTAYDQNTINSIFDLKQFSDALKNKLTNSVEVNNILFTSRQFLMFGKGTTLTLDKPVYDEGSTKIYKYRLSGFPNQPFTTVFDNYGFPYQIPITIYWVIGIDQNGKIEQLYFNASQ